MRRLLSVFFAFSLLLTSAVGEAANLPATCPQETCCCGGETPCCPPPAAPQSSCGQDQIPTPTTCGSGQAPLQTAQLPQAPSEVELAKTLGDPYAHPWPAAFESVESFLHEAKKSHFTMDVGGAQERVPDRLSKLRILRI